jgi:hypothetical protein
MIDDIESAIDYVPQDNPYIVEYDDVEDFQIIQQELNALSSGAEDNDV